MLKKIQRRPLAREQCAGAAGDVADDDARCALIAIEEMEQVIDTRVELCEHFEGHVESGKRARRLRQQCAPRAIALTDDRIGRDVATGQILCQRPVDEIAIIDRVKPGVQRQTRPQRKARPLVCVR